MVSALILGAVVSLAAGQGLISPFEMEDKGSSTNSIDTLVLAELSKHGIEAAPLCSDEVFIRRAYLDVIGTLPTASEVERFLQDTTPDKRYTLIEDLLGREEFADYWALKWCDILRVKSEFPINLWPNAVQCYHRWIRESIRDNKPCDEFAREMLTSSGSNFRVPPVNFYRAIQNREPEGIAGAVALTFMGARVEHWAPEQRDGMAKFFSRVAYKSTAEWKEEIVYLDPAPAEAMSAMLPDGVTLQLDPGKDPRGLFADWLLSADNPWFARNMANRVWSWLLGRGIIHEADDIRPDNPPSNPALLSYLEDELVRSGYDLRRLYLLILNSHTYQRSSIARSEAPEAELLFACYPVRRMDAEALIDAVCGITGTREAYSSAVPEPFSYIPDYQRSIALADGSITSPFLEMFGRPPRDTGLESERTNAMTDPQRLHLLNSSQIQRKIEQGVRSRLTGGGGKGDQRDMVHSVYLNILSRKPTEDETAAALRYAESSGLKRDQAMCDLAWALINTKEFLYRH
ncbi:MAG: DUF1553 domain-containing protein [Candidatus Hydrogenedentes bacterium]|nr:DUF1553 domain-containing protein [Candidatus Hydrogenedentota bacterium]